MAVTALVLAAGMGTRLRSRLAKVLHPVLGRPMVRHAVRCCQAAGMDVVVVVNHQEDAVRAALADDGVAFARQPQPKGTGDAVRAALADLPEKGTVLVIPGDVPLLRADTLRALLTSHGDGLVSCLSVQLDDPAAYGRIVRDRGELCIVEAAELSVADRARYREVNTGVYAFDLAFLRQTLPGLAPHPPKDEIYLTDVLALAAAQGRARVLAHAGAADEVMGVNDRWALAQAEASLGQRIKHRLALAGVTFQDPASTRVEVDVTLGQDVTVGPGCVLGAGTRLAQGVSVGPHCVLSRCQVGADATVHAHSVIEGAVVAPKAQVGPFARLRPGARLEVGARVGNFVEVKQAVIEAGAKVNHLSYIGDARVGAAANVGAGTITCNYDGVAKHHTEIGAGAFIGSNTALVAPVRVGDGAIVGAGTVVVQDVPADALCLARGRQTNKAGMARRIRARNEELARRAQQDG
ncbi:MAG: UDP-N-acetylglucosamine diphosphorylase/glucosamine-1-phosphate N-acetyltransferase [Oligoflexia bacterium]|nr:UDP-N-acetylglucosamine diphosphorylase/glucosamine-1-phosphate N-acetyltransferase [Oligoflexia bacterium]